MMNKYFTSFSILILICLNTIVCAQEIEYPFEEPGTAVSRGVFGKDDRKEVKDAVGYQDFVRATAVMVHKDDIYNNQFYSWSLRDLLINKFGVEKFDENVKFLDQPTIGMCTGFLIAPDILITAGHCINSMSQAKDFVWVFDYTSESNFIDGKRLNFKPENIFETIEIIDSKFDKVSKDDYAVLRLNKKSTRAPYRFRTSGSVLNQSKINTIGSPTGLPLKFATNAVVVDTSPKNWFKSDIDSFPGNSGGPVFDQNGFIEGILVRGAVEYSEGAYTGDYKYDASCDCIKTVQWDSVDYTAGCQAQKINTIPLNSIYTAIYTNLEYAILNNLDNRFNSWSIYNWIFSNDYTKEKGLLETLAIENNNLTALNKILDVTGENLSDNDAKKLLDLSIKLKNNEALKSLLDYNIYPDAGLESKNSALQLAITTKNNDAAKMLISYGANVKILTSNAENLLHLAARSGNTEIIAILLENGVDPGAKNTQKQLPEKTAKLFKHKSIAKILKKARRS